MQQDDARTGAEGRHVPVLRDRIVGLLSPAPAQDVDGRRPVYVDGTLGMGFGVVMTFFELLVQFLQAFIFTLLAALYISDAVSEHH